MMGGEFSTVQFFTDGTYEYVRRFVPAEEAVQAFHHYATSVTAQFGFTSRVIVIDGGDSIVAERDFGKGVVFPAGVI